MRGGAARDASAAGGRGGRAGAARCLIYTIETTKAAPAGFKPARFKPAWLL